MSDADAKADPAAAAAIAQASSFKAASDKLRERSETTAKALAALGTTGLTAVGIAKFSDIYPVPPGGTASSLLVIAGFLAMTLSLAGFTILLWDANRPLVTKVDPNEMGENEDEIHAIDEIYARVAKLNGVASLEAYQARAFRLQRIAERSDDAGATKLRASADRIRAEIHATSARAALIVIRQRINEALKGFNALLLALTFLAGLLAFGLASDHLDSERTAKVATLKACSEAAEAKVEISRLPDICKGVRSSPKEAKLSTEQTRAVRVKALSSSYASCINTAVEQQQPATMCDAIKNQLVTATQ